MQNTERKAFDHAVARYNDRADFTGQNIARQHTVVVHANIQLIALI